VATSVFFSFHYERDIARVQQVANIGALEGQALNRQQWEQVKRRGRQAIEDYIDREMAYKRAVVVLIGAQTASRPWVRYEIEKAWNSRKPLVGIRINGLKDFAKRTDVRGPDPFAQIELTRAGFLRSTLADYVPVHTPVGADSQAVYRSITNNIHTWIDNAYRRP
jgi:hypothetical protein